MKIMIDSEYLDRLKPIKEYDFISGEKLIILDDKSNISDGNRVGFGYIDDKFGTVYPTLFDYTLNNNKVTDFYGVANGIIIELKNGKLVTSTITAQEQ